MNSLVPGVRIGHAGDATALTGCTVIVPDTAAVASVDVRGGAPGTRETDLLRPGMLVERVDAILLTGGSAFGLAAADGVMRWLEERGRGFPAGAGGKVRVPIVPAAVIFDLQIGDGSVRPDAATGYAACEAAAGALGKSADGSQLEGSVGAGLGATVGKLAGPKLAVRGGVGLARRQLRDGTSVGALVVVNALGDIYDPQTGQRIAGSRIGSGQQLSAAADVTSPPPGNTTLAVVATDARLSKSEAQRLAVAAQAGLARVIKPVHTEFDGDTVFTVATGARDGNATVIGLVAADLIAEAVIRAVKLATSAPGVPAWRDLEGGSDSAVSG